MGRKKRMPPLVNAFLSMGYVEGVEGRLRTARETILKHERHLGAEDIEKLRKALKDLHSALVSIGALATHMRAAYEEPPSDEELKAELGI